MKHKCQPSRLEAEPSFLYAYVSGEVWESTYRLRMLDSFFYPVLT